MINAIGGFLRRNLRLIVKPIALVILFFVLVVWLYFAYSPVILEGASKALGRSAMVAEESARLNSLGSFLSALFQGNLGYSSIYLKPVWSILSAVLGTTVLLIVLSTVISFATGVIFAFIALKLEPKSRRPMIFSHSQKGFFFGLTSVTGFILIILFSYGLGWFPSSNTHPDFWLIYPPENIFAEIADRLRHLALPAFTLIIVFMVRSFFVVWSGGSHLTSKKILNRLLFPFTTIDFACIISAVVLIEWTFIFPGVGYLLLLSVERADFTMIVGAFIVLLAVAVILECISVLSGFVMQRLGLYENSEKKVGAKSGTKKTFPPSTKHTPLTRIVRQVFERKSLVVGFVIVGFFVVMAAFAPLITPYDPVSLYVPSTDTPIAAHLAKPVWYKYLPGAEPVSENFQAVQRPSFDTADSLEELNFTTSLAQEVLVQFISDIGYKEDGCVAIVFEREETEAPFGQVKAGLFREFNFPYEVPPERFIGQAAILVDNPQNIPISINLVFEKVGSETRIVWTDKDFRNITAGWITPYPSISSDSYATRKWLNDTLGPEWFRNPAAKMFPESADYKYGVEVTFNDTKLPTGEKVEATIYVDDFDFKLFGTAFGLLGTDQYGRDIFTQVVYGARTMLIATVPIVAVAALIGLTLGFLAGYFQNWADNLVMVFVDTTLATPVLPLLIVFHLIHLIYWYPRISWFPILLWPLCALATKASRNVYLLRPKNQKLSGNTIRSRLLNLFKDFSTNFCLVMVSVALLNLIIDIYLFGFYESAANWSSVLYSALYTPRGHEFWWWWVSPIACVILFTVGFLLIGIKLDERP
jgi:peptide/nickel transport system permease protein